MEPLILYPSQDRLNKALMAGVALMVVPFLIGYFGLGGMVPYLPHVCMFAFFGGAVLIGKSVMMGRVKDPVFAADQYGFSLHGGRKLEWGAFKGVETMPFDMALVVQADGVVPRGRVEIKTLELSGPAREMAKQIEDYAALAQRNALLGGAVGLGGMKPRRGGVAPATLEEATQVVGAAPVQARPLAKSQDVLTTGVEFSDPASELPPLALYPRKNGAIKALIGAAAFGAVGAMVLGLEDVENAAYSGWVFIGLGAISGTLAGLSLLSRGPSFAADTEGFSVRGKAKRGWDEFRGVRVRTVRYGWVPVARDVVVRTGKSMLGGSVTINALYQSAPAAEMAAEIEHYAHMVKLRAARHVGARASARVQSDVRPVREFGGQLVPEMPETGPMPEAARTQAALPQMLQDAQRPSFMDRVSFSPDEGPISSAPRLSERLFGRRKVI